MTSLKKIECMNFPYDYFFILINEVNFHLITFVKPSGHFQFILG